ncbi:unnamed protein product [Nippostrongylus brasiliensis]|uniref:Uncharacterized protein n=1 Tax=Nippostrongylus brasiliensis TaxID=27835 RepID=A0A0N4XDQ5_NIPBR|nr:unnamed protein product [Nippostrongylus brasiliensis]
MLQLTKSTQPAEKSFGTGGDDVGDDDEMFCHNRDRSSHDTWDVDEPDKNFDAFASSCWAYQTLWNATSAGRPPHSTGILSLTAATANN